MSSKPTQSGSCVQLRARLHTTQAAQSPTIRRDCTACCMRVHEEEWLPERAPASLSHKRPSSSVLRVSRCAKLGHNVRDAQRRPKCARQCGGGCSAFGFARERVPWKHTPKPRVVRKGGMI